MAFEKTLNDFLAHAEDMTEETYHKEFMSLKFQSQKYKEKGTYPAEAGQLPCNKKKNRFKDILPFEYTRVSLHPIEGVEGSDYINANYITGTGEDVTYIAAQGPLPNTVCDFWRMLWYHSIEIVVMACRIVENAKPKCESYWPDKNSTREFSGISVTTTAEENKSNDFVVRDFLMECGGEKQYIRQYHYTAWPDHGKPDSAEPIIKMLEMVHDHRKRADIPLLFHCSAGCGRTGTMIAIDISRTMFLSKSLPEKFSVYSLVEKMRRQRPSMVQAKDQYQFVYESATELARRALGFKPTVPAKPQSSPKVVCDSSDGIYANTAAPSPPPKTPSPDLPKIKESGDTTVEHSYVNTPAVPLAESSSEASTPSPPVAKRPIARQRSSKSSLEQEPSYENIPAKSALPVPPVKPAFSSSPASGSSPVPSPKPRRTVRRHKDQPPPPASPKPPRPENSPALSKKLPPPPAQKPQREKHSPELPPTPPRSSTPSKLKEPERSPSSQDDNAYSVVDMSQITDVGPGIEVIDEVSGKKAPLARVEQQMDPDSMMDVSKSSSIMDTLLSLVGEDVINEVESKEKEEKPLPPLPPPVGQRTMSMVDEAPPAIPTRTEASYHLVEEVPDEVEAVEYNNVKPTEDNFVGGTADYEMVSAAPLKSPKDVPGTAYEAPTPLSKRVSDSPPPLPADRTTAKSVSMDHLQPSSTITLPAAVGHGPSSSRNSHTSTRTKLSKLFGKSKSEKRKHLGDISGPVGAQRMDTRMTRSPSDQAVSSSSSSSRPSPAHSTSSLVANSRYNFPGELGFGIRICKPIGPRQEPNEWKLRTLTNSVA